MKNYFAKSINHKNIELFLNDEFVGRIVYPKWYSYDVTLETLKDKFEIKMEGFWNGKMVQYNAQNLKVRELKNTWTGNLIKETFGEEYFLKMEGFLNFRYELKSKSGKKLMTVFAKGSWKKFTLDYEIEVEDELEKDTDFILAVIHIVNYNLQLVASHG